MLVLGITEIEGNVVLLEGSGVSKGLLKDRTESFVLQFLRSTVFFYRSKYNPKEKNDLGLVMPQELLLRKQMVNQKSRTRNQWTKDC